MKISFLPALMMAAMLLCTPASASNDKPVKSASPLSADELAIYNAVLRQYSEGNDIALNVSQTTYPLDSSSPMSDLSADCLQGIQLDLAAVSHTFHKLSHDVLPGPKMKLVDPKKQTKAVRSNDPGKTIRNGKPVKDAVENAFFTGLFSMSEIAFDKEHRFAVVSYSFYCGELCGHGATLVFEKINGEWRKTGRHCANWIS
jgi:hypothetical protein